MSKRILVSFGRSDPLHLTEATHDLLGDGPTYVWGPDFGREKPQWAKKEEEIYAESIYDAMWDYDTVYCGHGATLLEATAAGCEVMVLHWLGWSDTPEGQNRAIEFVPAWTASHLDHSGNEIKWWEPGVMAAMAAEIRARRK